MYPISTLNLAFMKNSLSWKTWYWETFLVWNTNASTWSRPSWKFCRDDVLKKFSKFIGKQLQWSPLLIKLWAYNQPAALPKCNFFASVSLQIAGIFSGQLFCSIPVDCLRSPSFLTSFGRLWFSIQGHMLRQSKLIFLV